MHVFVLPAATTSVYICWNLKYPTDINSIYSYSEMSKYGSINAASK